MCSAWCRPLLRGALRCDYVRLAKWCNIFDPTTVLVPLEMQGRLEIYAGASDTPNHQIAESGDSVVPNSEQILEKSHDRWQQYIKQEPSIGLDCLDLHNLMARVPGIPTGHLRMNRKAGMWSMRSMNLEVRLSR
jgi:hypothetical protein